jgi:adenosylcobinamide-phosphate synthase
MPSCPWECWALPVGVALDALLGDPRGWPHPVRLVGRLTRGTERALRAVLAGTGIGRRGWLEYGSGVVLLAFITGSTGLAVWGLQTLAARVGGLVPLAVESVLVYWGLAIRSLGVEVLRASEEADLGRARDDLALVVGRDTEALDRPEICRACVETVSENCNDAVIAPLFWFVVGGAVGLWVYKSVNTLDSMVGYRDERYRRLGWASARADDLVGLLPARLTWLFISAASAIVGESPLVALRTGWRDGRKHPSPNAAWGEAAMAGALGVQLGGLSLYDGVLSEKPRLGDPGGPIGPGTVRRAVRVMTVASVLAACIAWAARVWFLCHA